MSSIFTAHTKLRTLITAVSAAVFVGCGGSDSTPTPPVIPGTLAVVAAPTALAVLPGASGTATATITRGGSFSGAATLSAEGAPTGVTVSFASATLAAGATSSDITIAVASTAAAGSFPIAIKAAGAGVTTAAATLTLTIGTAVTPSIAVSVAPTSASILAGNSGTATATIVRNGGFTGAVALTSSGAPAGMTVTFAPTSIATGATTSAMTIAVGGTVPAGSYPITVSAAGTGVATVTAVYTATVTVPSGGGTTVSLSYCAADAPIWVAAQDGTGAWSRLTPTGVNTYSFTVSSGRAGVATVDTVGTGFDLNVVYATTSEFNGFGNTLSLGACGGKTVNGTVANVSATQFANVSLGYSSAFVIPITSSAFSLTNVASGAQDLFASRLTAATQRVDRMILRRALNIADGGTIPVLDFGAAEAFAPATANVTLTGLAADTASILSLFNGTRGATFGLIGTISSYVAASGAKAYDAIPSAQLNTTELQQLFATTSGATSSRFSGVYFRSPTDRTIAMGPTLSAPTVTRDNTGPYSRTRVQLPVQTDYNRFMSADYTQSSGNRSATVTITTGYTNGAAWDVTLPDLTSVAGWLNTWGLQNGTGIRWSISAQGGSLNQLDQTITDGSTFKSASASSSTPLP
jgi:hypothetical protein